MTALAWKSHVLCRQPSLTSPHPSKQCLKHLFLKQNSEFLIIFPFCLNSHRIGALNDSLNFIHLIFRINLNKPCKSLKKELSCCPYVAKRCTCQYHGIRYSVCPETEFGNKYQIFGIT